MAIDVSLRCSCGAVSGELRGVTPANSFRLSCLCDDCQMYAHHLGRAGDLLDAHGGTDLSYATQSRLSIATGREHLCALRLSEGGLLRWYAGCCHTPVAHTPSPKVAFVAIPHLFMSLGGAKSRDEALGPLVRRLQGRFAVGGPPPDAHLGTPLGLRVNALGRIVWDTLRGRHLPSPFHATVGEPVVAPVVLTEADRARLRARLPKRAALVVGAGRLGRSCS